PWAQSRQTALLANQPLGLATVTRPFHPLFGQTFEVLKVRRLTGRESLSLRHPERGSLAILRDWTDWAPPGASPPPACPDHAAGRPSNARNAARRLQALRPSKLSLRQWAGPWPEALSLGQSTGRPPAPRLCAQYRRRSRRSVHQQPAITSGRARPDMRHQHRVIAASRRPWIDRLGSFTCPVRLDAGRRYSRQYGHVLP